MMPPIRQRQQYGYLYHPDRVEVYTLTGRYLGDIERRMKRNRWGGKYRIPVWILGGVEYQRLKDAAAALERHDPRP